MGDISAAVDQAFPELFGWLASTGTAPAGPPFIRFLVIDMEALLQLDLGVPVAGPVTGAGRIRPGVLPGRQRLGIPARGIHHRPVQGAGPRQVGDRRLLPAPRLAAAAARQERHSGIRSTGLITSPVRDASKASFTWSSGNDVISLS